MKKAIQWMRWANPMKVHDEFVPETVGEPGWSPDADIQVDVRPVIPTADGLLPVTVYGKFSSNFNFWVMHANFNLSRRVIEIIRRVPGVEALDVVSRYRARVGFGKCFDDHEVRRNIEISLDVGVDGDGLGQGEYRIVFDEKTGKVIDMLREMGGEGRWWAIYVLPNGEIDFRRGSDAPEHRDIVGLYNQSQQLAGGVVITSDDDR